MALPFHLAYRPIRDLRLCLRETDKLISVFKEL
jgi:hypothetical protein